MVEGVASGPTGHRKSIIYQEDSVAVISRKLTEAYGLSSAYHIQSFRT
jgi:hypothetical protein